jgi:UDP-glucose:(glucosyl)LPS alpha-1,2-glucosyltransferase
MSCFEENEISIKANGGTEIAKRRLAELLPQDLMDNFQVVSSRIRELKEDKIRIFWANDLPQDPESAQIKDAAFRNKFHKLVFISDWQYEQYRTVLNVPYSDHSVVIETGIDPILFPDSGEIGSRFDSSYEIAKQDAPIRLVYTSTPQRGLNLLVPVFLKLHETFGSDIHLDVFSSFKLYGWDAQDEQFHSLFETIKNHPAMTYHEIVSNKDLKEFLLKCHIFAYPSTWPETSCRALIEAMSAGLLCVHPNFAAMPLTSGGLNLMYQGDVDIQKHANIFASALNQSVLMIKNRDAIFKSRIEFNKHYADSRFSIEKISSQWKLLLEGLVAQYPVDKRSVPEKVFSYRTIQRSA